MHNLQILLVEDNEGDIILTLEALKDSKIRNEVDVVKDGWEALRYIEQASQDKSEPDLILLDVNLPKINGHEVLEKLRKNEHQAHIPVVMFTTSSSEDDILKSYQNRADCYITKPVDANDFPRVTKAIEDFWLSYSKKN
jgi:CheY-like chemotaxis protein